ncbi:unnamed protein product [Absidia cylindrospora]
MEQFKRQCRLEGCCHIQSTTTTTTTTMTIENSAVIQNKTMTVASTSTALILPPTNKTLPQEVGHAVLKMPTTLQQLGTDVWTHLVAGQPKKPSWNIQTTVILGFMQAFRDHTYTNSLDFWRFILIAPTFLTPLTSQVQDGSFVIKPRPLDCVGLLRTCDLSEKNQQRVLEVEWMSALSVWDTCWQSIWPSASNNSNNNNNNSGVKKSTEKIILYLHGGAYCAMSAQTHRTLTHKISKSTGRRVFAINYRLAPETKFPGALYDAVQAFLYLIDPTEKYNFDPKRILVMGDSAGGGLALAMLLYLRDHDLPSPEGACLLSPWVDLSFSYPSWNSASLFDYLPNNPDKLTGMNPQKLYLGDDFSASMLKHPYVSPLFAEHFEHLPPIMIQSGGCESLRDEIDALYQKINQSNTTFIHNEVYQDMVHVFQAFPLGKSVEEAIDSIGWWARLGISMIAKYQVKQQQQQQQRQITTVGLSSSSAQQQLTKSLIMSGFSKKDIPPPILLGRRHRSIPG